MKITIAGYPGAGKGELRKRLQDSYGIPSFSVGDLRRQYAKERGMTIQELNELGKTDYSTDINADHYQTAWAKERNNFIVEGRLSYHFIPDSIRIFLTVSDEVSAQRILKAKRETEQKTTSLEEQVQINQERCRNDRLRYQQIHGIENCYSDENFDIVVDTSNKTPDQVAKLVKAKITDYENKMRPLTFYLGHPTESRAKVREWEEGFEGRNSIQLTNPFFDTNTLESQLGNLGKEKYLSLKEKGTVLFRSDIEAIATDKVIGSVFLFDESYTLGTPIELSLTKLMGKLAYSVVTHPEKAYRFHPSILTFSDKIFLDLNEAEDFLKNNERDFYRLLEESRQRTVNDETFKTIFDNIDKNRKFFAR